MKDGLIKVGDRVPYRRDGGPAEQRYVKGFLRYSEPPVPGTLVAPSGWTETGVILGTRLDRTLIGLATSGDIEYAAEHDMAGVPGSTLHTTVMRTLAELKAARLQRLTR